MKVKVIRDRKSKSKTLVIRPVKHEALEYDQAEWLRTYDGTGLVPFRYVRENEVTLYYDVTGLVDLKSYLKAEISLDQFRRILLQMAELLGTCTRRQLPTSAIQFDPEHVYIDAQGAPLFVFVPLSGVPERRESSPVAFLHYLGGRHVRFVVGEDDRHAMALEDFASRNQVLSLSALREFLQRDLGVTVHGDSGPLGSGSGSLGASGSLGGAAAGPVTGSFGGYVAPSAPDAHPGYATSYRPPRPAGIGRGPQVGTAAAAFDPVAMLTGAASASQVVRGQAMGTRVRNAVGGKSPTAAVVSTGAVAPISAMVPPAPAVPGVGVPAPGSVAPGVPDAPAVPGVPVVPVQPVMPAQPVAPVMPGASPWVNAPATSAPITTASVQPNSPATANASDRVTPVAPVTGMPNPGQAPEAVSANDDREPSPAYAPRPGAPVPPEGVRPVAAAAMSVASGRFRGMPSSVLREAESAGEPAQGQSAVSEPQPAPNHGPVSPAQPPLAVPAKPEASAAPAPGAAQSVSSVPVAPASSAAQAFPSASPQAPAPVAGPVPAQAPVTPAPVSPASPAAGSHASAPAASGPAAAFVAPMRSSSGGTTLLAGAAVASPVVSAFAQQARRLVLERASDGERLVLPQGSAVIGRSASSDVQISGNTNISRSHVEVSQAREGITLRDLGSANGTFVAGRRLARDESVQLPLGEPFRLADEDFRVVQE